MSRELRRKKAETQLYALEQEFTVFFQSSLRRCAAGRWGLFGHNSHLPGSEIWYRSPDREKLLELGDKIMELREFLGVTERFQDLQIFEKHLGRPGPNTLGEPKIAIQILAERFKE